MPGSLHVKVGKPYFSDHACHIFDNCKYVYYFNAMTWVVVYVAVREADAVVRAYARFRTRARARL